MPGIPVIDSPLVGTWALERFELRLPDGETTYPYGEEVGGLLMYDPIGHMSAVFGSVKHPVSAEVDLEKAGASQSYDAFMSYCGPYEIHGSRIIHRVAMSSLEAWTGTTQERSFEISGDVLTLETMALVVGEASPVGRLMWRRLGGSPATS
ncbi:MAG: lipocalin-like domain-containing protein [Myxococcota bacterium]|jgi:hypothetical protein|nr:lipocalin-like domain-containing protein [Myxococcota bacterium]